MAMRPKLAFRHLFEITTTQVGSGVVWFVFLVEMWES